MDRDPFRLLGLDPDQADRQAIRRAYARLIKTHRPDSDPVGFQHIREAYTNALATISGATGPHAAGDSRALREPEPIIHAPPLMLFARRQVAAVAEHIDPRASRRRQDLDAAIRHLTIVWRQHPDHVAATRAWAATLLALRPLSTPWVLAVDAEDLHVAIQRDARDIARVIIAGWQVHGRMRLGQLAGCLLQDLSHTAAPGAVADIAVDVAHAVAWQAPELARRLLDQAFMALRDGERTPDRLDAVDQAIAIGQDLQRLPKAYRTWLTSVLRAGDWDGRRSAVAEAGMRWLRGHVPMRCALLHYVRSRMPRLAEGIWPRRLLGAPVHQARWSWPWRSLLPWLRGVGLVAPWLIIVLLVSVLAQPDPLPPYHPPVPPAVPLDALTSVPFDAQTLREHPSVAWQRYRLFQDDDVSARGERLEALLRPPTGQPKQAWLRLLAALSIDDAPRGDQRARIAERFCDHAPPEAWPILLRLINEPDERIVTNARLALRRIAPLLPPDDAAIVRDRLVRP